MEAAELLGRDYEQAVLRRLLDRASSGPAGLLLDGEAGIGKTTLWREGIALANERGFRVLACEAAPTQTPLAFAALGDLLDEVPLESREQLPPPQRRALEASLLLIEPSDGTADQRAASVAVLTLVRALASTTPVLIAIDDVQWLDSSSARVLAFVLRRLREGPIGLLMTHRSDEGAGGKLPLELVERFVGALDFLTEDGIAVHLCLGCDRWTAVAADRALIEGLLLGLSLRAHDHMHQGGLLSLETSLTRLDESNFEETGLPPGEYVRVSVSDTGGWSDGALHAWTTRMGSPRRFEQPSLAALRHAAEIVGGALVCARHACCGERANLYLPATRRHIRSGLALT